MHNAELSRQLQRINHLIDRTEAASRGEIEIQSHWAKYLCILCAGLIENALAELYSDFARRTASEPVARYAGRSLARIQNPNAQRFIETAFGFKDQWGTELEAFLESDGRKDAINSIMSNRHLIAHGGDSGITIARLRPWLEKSIEVIEFIEAQCRR
jgi:hypothetical protein